MEPPVCPIEQAQQGDRAAQETLGAWCLRHAFRLAYVDLAGERNRQPLADEIAGEASLKAMTCLDQFEPGTQFGAWLHRIVRNCLRDHFRREDRTVPPAVYLRWVHDFLAGYGPELEALIQDTLREEASEPHPVLLQRIANDLTTHTYRQFLDLVYEGRANIVLDAVKQRLRAFVGVEWLPLYRRDQDGEWMATELPSDDTTEAQVLQQEFIQEVNERLALLQPLCRRMIRWYYLDHLRMSVIARLERMAERTAYRRLENCAAAFRTHLLRDGYFAELAAEREAPGGSRKGYRRMA